MGLKEQRLANKSFTCCSIEGCNRHGSIQRGVETFRKGFCEAHYQRFRKYGDAEYPMQRCQHGLSVKKHPLYRIWSGIKNRVFNKNNSHYPDYGGRGITICDRWTEVPHGFFNFINDVGERPSPLYSIDRINNNGHYEPCNVKWSTPHEQSANQRSKGKYLGVRWRAEIKKWVVNIRVNNKRYYLGSYTALEDAINKRREAEIALGVKYTHRPN